MNTVTEPTSSAGKANKPLLLIIAIAVMATVVPYIMYYTGVGIPAGTTNQGILLSEPVLVSEFTFRDEHGEVWDLAKQQPKFRLMVPVRGACDEVCRDSLYLMRQVDTRLSDKSDQLERFYIQLGEEDSEGIKQFLASEHPGLQYLQGSYREWQSALGDRPELSANFDGGEYYLLHRYGALAMAYNDQHSGNQLLDDLKFLIKTSN